MTNSTGLISWRNAVSPERFPAILCRNLDKLEERFPFLTEDGKSPCSDTVVDWLYVALKAGKTNKKFAISAAKAIREMV
jgi:hypothetical protein